MQICIDKSPYAMIVIKSCEQEKEKRGITFD